MKSLHRNKWVWDEYDTARSAFIRQATQCNAKVGQCALPEYRDSKDTPLSLDGAYLGAARPAKLTLVLSGVHGLEAPAGSAVQSVFLNGAVDIAADNGLLMIHAVNPYGFANKTRANESNVDLNRSFIDRQQPSPRNYDYADFHPYFCPEKLNDASLIAAREFIELYERRHGESRANDAIGAGQYDYPDGLYYGGKSTPWSVSALFTLIDELVDRSRLTHINVVDLHTGRGEFGEPFFLFFDPLGSKEYALIEQCWGKDRLSQHDELASKYQSYQAPKRHGLVLTGIRRFFEPALTAGCVIEFGTYDLWTMYEAELADRWVRFRGSPGDSDTQRLKSLAFRAFTPEENHWRTAVLKHGIEILETAVQGTKSWQ